MEKYTIVYSKKTIYTTTKEVYKRYLEYLEDCADDEDCEPEDFKTFAEECAEDACGDYGEMTALGFDFEDETQDIEIFKAD